MMQHHKYSLEEIENMLPWEREVYIGLLSKFLEDEKEKLKKEQQQRGQSNGRQDNKDC